MHIPKMLNLQLKYLQVYMCAQTCYCFCVLKYYEGAKINVEKS